MKTLLVFISGQGTALNHIAMSCHDGILKGIAQMVYAISDQLSPPGFVIAKKWQLTPISVPFCHAVNDTQEEWNKRIVGNSFWPPKPDLVIFAGFTAQLILPDEYAEKLLVVNDDDDPVTICEMIAKRLGVDTTMPRLEAGASPVTV